MTPQPQRYQVPRGVGLDKRSLEKYRREIDATKVGAVTFARRRRLPVEGLCVALGRAYPEWWAEHCRRFPLPVGRCAYCERDFIPSKAGQRFCGRKCSATARTDRDYFGGRRRETVGLADGVCQCCRKFGKTLSSHHVWGKGNDPENSMLVALCQGCHEVVTALALRNFLDDAGGWERLIDLVHRRRQGWRHLRATTVAVSIEEAW